MFSFQLETELNSALHLGFRWKHDFRRYIADHRWPAELQKRAPNPEAYEDEPSQMQEHAVIEDLELDDKHAEFLDPIEQQEQDEDEVERLLGKVAEQCEVLHVSSQSLQSSSIL